MQQPIYYKVQFEVIHIYIPIGINGASFAFLANREDWVSSEKVWSAADSVTILLKSSN